MIETAEQLRNVLDFMAKQSERAKQQAANATESFDSEEPKEIGFQSPVGSAVRTMCGHENFLPEPIQTADGPKWVPIKPLGCY